MKKTVSTPRRILNTGYTHTHTHTYTLFLPIFLQVKVLVKPIRGPYQGWIFEAGTSQQADDDLPWLYCGILYAYDVSQVYLSVPVMSNSNYTIGKAFCIGRKDSFVFLVKCRCIIMLFISLAMSIPKRPFVPTRETILTKCFNAY